MTNKKEEAKHDSIIGKIGQRITHQRRLILDVINSSQDHPDVDTLHQRVREQDSSIGISTIYRTLRVLKDEGLLDSHDFRNADKTRYELMPDQRHGHLIDSKNGEVLEFSTEALEVEFKKIAEKAGYNLEDYRIDLYGSKKD